MLKKFAFAAVAVALSAGAAHAAVLASQGMNVQVQVTPTCAISGLGNYDFGTIGGTVTNFTAPAINFNVNCSTGLAYTVRATPTNPVAGSGNFQMNEATSGTNMEYYLEIFNFGSGSWISNWDNATNVLSSTGTGANQTTTVRGVIPAQAAPGGGWNTTNPYTDVVTVTVEN